MSTSPLVLAVPVFNGERFLAETLQSLNTNGEHLTWWLHDGASTDASLSIAQRWARPGDTVISEPDCGQADALNRAISRMGGEIIGFINSDDLLRPDSAARVLEFFAEHPETDMVYGSVEWIDEAGAVTGTHSGSIDSLADVMDIYGVWWQGRQFVQPEVFFRRTLWDKVGGFNTAYHLAFDYDFWVRCFLAGAKVARLPGTLSRFRIHGAQKSSAWRQAASEIRVILRHHLASNPPIPAQRRWAIEAQLSYDLYQSDAASQRRGFLGELLRHPNWLLSPQARSRVQAACTRIFTGAKDTT